MARFRQMVKRGQAVLTAIMQELERIPDYNAEGERLLRAMRNHRQDGADRIQVIRRVLNRNSRDRALRAGVFALLFTAVLVTAEAEAAGLPEAVRSLAENVLGTGAGI